MKRIVKKIYINLVVFCLNFQGNLEMEIEVKCFTLKTAIEFNSRLSHSVCIKNNYVSYIKLN